MAITLDPEDLIYPTGELQPGLFPDGGLEEHLEAWIEEAGSKTDDDSPAAKYVYWRAYSAVAIRLAMTPNSESNDSQQTQRSKSWGKDRIEFFEKKAAEYKAAFDAEIADPPGSAFGGLGMFRTAKAGRRRYGYA